MPEANILEALNQNLRTLYNALPPYTAFILFTGHSDPRAMAQLGQRKGKWDQLIRDGMSFLFQGAKMHNSYSDVGKAPSDIPREDWWSAQDGRLLEDECERAKRGLLFLSLKENN